MFRPRPTQPPRRTAIVVHADGVVRCGVCAVPIVGPNPAAGGTRIVGWAISFTPDDRVRVVLHADGTVLHECGRNLADALAEELAAFLVEPDVATEPELRPGRAPQASPTPSTTHVSEVPRAQQ